jgi:uncharacterized protein (TIGR02147 family)
MIAKDSRGRWSQKEQAVTIGDEVQSLNIVNYHKQVSRLAAGAPDLVPREFREISAVTRGINQEAFSKIKAELVKFRKKVITIANQTEPADRVYQLNFQFFPASSIKQGESE